MKTNTITLPSKFETAVEGDLPSETYNRSWATFLQTCELRDTHDGVVFLGSSNCNYIVFPCGYLVQNFGYHGRALMSMVKEGGKEAVLKRLKEQRDEIREIIRKLG
jgi:hypothetical protein